MLNHEDVAVVRSDGCQYGMRARDLDGKEYPVKKPTGWMSNADLLLKELSATCIGECEKHVPLLDGRPAAAATYPPELCAAIIRGLQRQWERDHKRLAPEIAAAIGSEEGEDHSSQLLGAVSGEADCRAEDASGGGPPANNQPSPLTTSIQVRYCLLTLY